MSFFDDLLAEQQAAPHSASFFYIEFGDEPVGFIDVDPKIVCDEEDADIINLLVADVYQDNVKAGWHGNPSSVESMKDKARAAAVKLALIHSEVSEALEGVRRGKMDDHLPHRPSVEVELADTLIRIFDLAGYLGLDLGGAFVEKRRYNATRIDHTPEARAAAGGKKF